jgi:hypothetical protein
MNLDQLLHDALHDDRLALPVPAGTLDAVRRKRRTRQRLAVAGTSVAALAVVGGAVSAATLLSSSSSTLSPYAAGGVPPGSPAPGITPAFVPESGRDWLLTDAEWQTYNASHTHPSPAPGQSAVHSPAPLAEQSAVLLNEVQQAGMPPGTTFHRDDSAGGQPNVADIQATLPGGGIVIIEERQMQEPFDYEGSAENTNPGATVFDVPGTSSAAVQLPQGPSVTVISRGGLSTSWFTNGHGVTLADLRAWAIAAEQHSPR